MKRTRRSSGSRQAAKDEDKRDKKRQAWAGDQEGPRESGAEHSSASEGADLGEWIRPALGGPQQQEQQQQLLLQHEQEQQEQQEQEQQEQQEQEREQQQHGRPGLAPNPRGVQLAPRRRASLSRRIPVTVPVAESGQPQQGHEPEPLQGTALPQASIQPSTSTFQFASEPIPPMQIHIKWASATGKTKITELPLKMVESTNDLTGVHKRLTNRVFAERDLPDFLVSDNYLKFSTCEECLNMPLDVLSTNFKLAAFKDGWQYVVHDSRVSAPETSDNQPKLHVTIIEFDSIAHIIGHLGIRMSMVAYPLITIHKEFLLTTLHQLRTDPNFRGIFAA